LWAGGGGNGAIRMGEHLAAPRRLFSGLELLTLSIKREVPGCQAAHATSGVTGR
jgi:hypothetical protein